MVFCVCHVTATGRFKLLHPVDIRVPQVTSVHAGHCFQRLPPVHLSSKRRSIKLFPVATACLMRKPDSIWGPRRKSRREFTRKNVLTPGYLHAGWSRFALASGSCWSTRRCRYARWGTASGSR
jgi:hypothetical protein